MPRKILRQPAVNDCTGLSTAQIWRLEKTGEFPARVQITPSSIGWYEDEIAAWIEARPRGGGRRPRTGRPSTRRTTIAAPAAA